MRETPDTDEALLLSGEPEDFGRFYDRYVRSLLAYFQRRTRDPEAAADLTAETFAAALGARSRFQPRAAVLAVAAAHEAVLRASKSEPGNGVSTFWLVDDGARKVLAGPAFERPGAAPGTRVVEVPGAAHVVRGERGGWFALGTPSMSNGHVAGATAGRDPVTGEPMVSVGLSEQGRSAFSRLTRDVARRGARLALPGANPLQDSQHIAIVLDDRVMSVPYVNYQEAPDGIDGRQGVQIEGGLTPQRAREIAAILASWPMPALVTPSR